jgi:hypothetical protein
MSGLASYVLQRICSSRVKEKVKGFIKIFSPESSPKRKRAPETPDQTSVGGGSGSKSELQDKFSISSLEATEDVQTAQMNSQNAFIPETYPVCLIWIIYYLDTNLSEYQSVLKSLSSILNKTECFIHVKLISGLFSGEWCAGENGQTSPDR